MCEKIFVPFGNLKKNRGREDFVQGSCSFVRCEYGPGGELGWCLMDSDFMVDVSRSYKEIHSIHGDVACVEDFEKGFLLVDVENKDIVLKNGEEEVKAHFDTIVDKVEGALMVKKEGVIALVLAKARSFMPRPLGGALDVSTPEGVFKRFHYSIMEATDGSKILIDHNGHIQELAPGTDHVFVEI